MKKILIRSSFIIIILISYIIVNKGFNKKGYSQKIILDDNYDWKCVVDDKFLNISKYEKNVFNIIVNDNIPNLKNFFINTSLSIITFIMYFLQ